MNEIIKNENNKFKELLDIPKTDLINKEDLNFLVEHKDHLHKVLNKTYIWRTDGEKNSIISDSFFPTLHGKFHQALREQKVQFNETLYLMKDFEERKIDISDKQIKMEQIKDKIMRTEDVLKIRKLENKLKKLELALKFSDYELEQARTAMGYRMKEVKGWQLIQDRLIKQMKTDGLSEEEIWQKDSQEIKELFFRFLTKMHGIKSSTDGAEYTNLVGLARWVVDQAKADGKFKEWTHQCDIVQLESLRMLGEIK